MNQSGEVIAGVGTSNALAAVLSDDKTSLQVVADGAAAALLSPPIIRRPSTIWKRSRLPALRSATTRLGFLIPAAKQGCCWMSDTPAGRRRHQRQYPEFFSQQPGPDRFHGAAIFRPVGFCRGEWGHHSFGYRYGAPAPGGGNFQLFFGPSFDLLRGGPVIDDHGDVVGSRLTSIPVGGILGFGGIFDKDGGCTLESRGRNGPFPIRMCSPFVHFRFP